MSLTVETGTHLLTWPMVFTITIPQGKVTRLFARLKVTTSQ